MKTKGAAPSTGSATKPLLIGQAPGPNTSPEHPLWPRPLRSGGGRLWALTGMSVAEYLRVFDRVNLLYEFPGRHKRDDKFPRTLGRVAAQAMRPFLHGRTVILVGRNVARAFGAEDAPWFEWRYDTASSFHFVVIPHPSGRNPWYRKAENMGLSDCFWRQFSKGQKDVAFLSPVRQNVA